MRALPDRLRAFVALRLNAATNAAIARFVQEIHCGGDGITWVREANLHLTLRFLGGAVPVEQLSALDGPLKRLAEATSAFAVSASGTGVFPNLERPRVLWVGLRSASLAGLAARVEATVRECGFAPEPRLFTPHLTIGRVRHWHSWVRLRERLAHRAQQDFGESLIESMILYQSVPGPGASYEVIAQYPFQSLG
jgi:RNA 2',3'-cyclic 3'-phosphodiesterase